MTAEPATRVLTGRRRGHGRGARAALRPAGSSPSRPRPSTGSAPMRPTARRSRASMPPRAGPRSTR